MLETLCFSRYGVSETTCILCHAISSHASHVHVSMRTSVALGGHVRPVAPGDAWLRARCRRSRRGPGRLLWLLLSQPPVHVGLPDTRAVGVVPSGPGWGRARPALWAPGVFAELRCGGEVRVGDSGWGVRQGARTHFRDSALGLEHPPRVAARRRPSLHGSKPPRRLVGWGQAPRARGPWLEVSAAPRGLSWGFLTTGHQECGAAAVTS